MEYGDVFENLKYGNIAYGNVFRNYYHILIPKYGNKKNQWVGVKIFKFTAGR